MCKPRINYPVALLLAALALAATACIGQRCTLAGCEDGLEVAVQPEEAFGAGVYRLRLTDGAVTLADCELDLAAEEGSTFDVRSPESCAARISTRDGLLVAFTPEVRSDVRVVLDLDGDVLVDETLEPEYEDVYPNGPECGAGCRAARVELSTN